MDVLFFASPAELREWFETNHEQVKEVWIGYYKKHTGKPSITWPESVDEALCFGWIDGIRKSIDDTAYKIRFTPRKPGSNWSQVNIRRVGELIEAGRMQPAGLKAFEARDAGKNREYSYEREEGRKLDTAYEDQLKANTAAWDFFQAQPPSYQRAASHWVMSAKQKVTRQKRLATLIEDSAAGLRIKELRRAQKT
jgi:uncharacterized protein YdeI (YjbR/CyaY-like superfamily)